MLQSQITQVVGREVLDSRGKPTVEAEIHLADGSVGRAIAPSGASTGHAEAHELRDNDPSRYDGQGVLRAVEHVNGPIAAAAVGLDAVDQQRLDRRLLALDGTTQKSALGANAILAVSLATAHAAASSQRLPLFRHLHRLLHEVSPNEAIIAPTMPPPMTNMISGGAHANRNLDIQDVLIIAHADDYRTQLEWIVRVYRRLGELLRRGGYEGYLVGDEGGYGPKLTSNRQGLEVVVAAIEAAGLRPGTDVTLALDVASTQFYRDGRYHLVLEGKSLDAGQMIDLLESWVRDFPISSIEDGLADEDWSGWHDLTRRLGDRVRLVGDDLFTTNQARLQRGVEIQVGNSVLVKVNQIGTLTETFETIGLARRQGYAYVVSARSGETEDDTIADLAVATAAEHIKIGSIVRSERLAKYNRLLRIAEELDAGR